MAMGDIINLALNVLMAGLLAVTIGYCWVLNRRIKVLQDSRSELAHLLRHFDESTHRASESIIALQTASKKIGENIQFRIDKANYLIEDLSFMIEKGSKLSNQMEAGIAVGRARTRVEDDIPGSAPLETPRQEEAKVTRMEKPASSRDKTAASLEAVLERVVGRTNPAQEPETERGRQPARNRSRAEQELLDMIKAGIKG
jgi:hypothetical protein